MPDTPQIDVAVVHALLRGDTPPLLLDVREPWEWQAGHIEDARLIPLATLPDQIGTLEREHPTVVLCHLGVRSDLATMYLRQQGFTQVWSMIGGMEAWQEMSYPIV